MAFCGIGVFLGRTIMVLPARQCRGISDVYYGLSVYFNRGTWVEASKIGQLLPWTVVMMLIIFVTRFLPFWLKHFFERSVVLREAGVLLPGCIMVLLALFSLREVNWGIYPYGSLEAGSLLLSVVIYYLYRNLLLAFLPSLVLYVMVLNYIQ